MALTPPLLSSPFFASSASPSLRALQHRPGLENSTLQQRERGRGREGEGAGGMEERKDENVEKVINDCTEVIWQEGVGGFGIYMQMKHNFLTVKSRD